ncbi:MAG: hypothetical protein JXN65_03560 [Clostridia bacterium]|nr:hypothetical protein [Clostridia bacterium]
MNIIMLLDIAPPPMMLGISALVFIVVFMGIIGLILFAINRFRKSYDKKHGTITEESNKDGNENEK